MPRCLDASMRLDAVDASMQPPCHNVGISTQHDSIKILNLKHSVTIQLSEPERRGQIFFFSRPSRKKSARIKVVGYGHVAPFAGRCAGSRRPDHARRPFFVRSRRHARAHPRRAIPLSAGPLWSAHQHSHIHLWPHTTISMGGDKKQVRNEGDIDSASLTQHAMYEHVSHQCDCGWEPTVQQAHSIPFASIVASMLPLHPATPAIPRPTILHPAVPGPRPLYVLCTGRLAVSARLGRPAALLAFVVRDAQGVH
jgi:hypothetical protein